MTLLTDDDIEKLADQLTKIATDYSDTLQNRHLLQLKQRISEMLVTHLVAADNRRIEEQRE